METNIQIQGGNNNLTSKCLLCRGITDLYVAHTMSCWEIPHQVKSPFVFYGHRLQSTREWI